MAGILTSRLRKAHRRREHADTSSALAKTAQSFKRQLLVEVLGKTKEPEEEEPAYIALKWRSVFTAADLDAFFVTLERVISVAQGFAETHGWDASLGKGFRSSKEEFVRKTLKPIYEECFAQRAAAGSGERDSQGVFYSPFTRFAIAVMAEMHVDLSTDIVRRALKPSRRKQP